MTRTDLPLSLSLSRKELPLLTLLKGSSVVLKGSIVVVVNWSSKNLGGDSIDILDGLNPSLNPSLNHFSIQCLPKRVLNLVLNPSLNPSLKF